MITEERFQKMSVAQWVFHYRECVRAEQKKAKEQKAILGVLEAYSMYSHPKIDLQKMLQNIEQRRLRENAPDMQKELEADYELAKQMMPEVLNVVLEESDTEKKPILPLAKKRKGKARLKKKDL